MMENQNIISFKSLIKPCELKNKLPLSDDINNHIISSRKTVEDIINKKINKKLIVVGPCSVHNVEEALAYGIKLKKISDQLKDKFFIVMRVYFEKTKNYWMERLNK